MISRYCSQGAASTLRVKSDRVRNARNIRETSQTRLMRSVAVRQDHRGRDECSLGENLFR